MRFFFLACVLPVFACGVSTSSTETVTSPALSMVALSPPKSGPGNTHVVAADLTFEDGSSRVCTAHMKIDSLGLDVEYAVPQGAHEAKMALTLPASATGSFSLDIGVKSCDGAGVSNTYAVNVD